MCVCVFVYVCVRAEVRVIVWMCARGGVYNGRGLATKQKKALKQKQKTNP